MPLLPTLLFLAQALPVALESPAAPELSPAPPRSIHSKHRHGDASPSPSPSPEVRITVVNATCVPSISLSTSTPALPADYPVFPQGEWTANAPVTTPEVHYLVRNTNGTAVVEKTLHFKPVSSQFVLLTGDLDTKGPADTLRGIDSSLIPADKPCTPNLQFQVFPYQMTCPDPCRYRIINGMPGKMLILRTTGDEGQPRHQLALLSPGNGALLVHQPPSVAWEAEIDGQTYPVIIRQEGAAGNCLVPFFLRDGKPDFVRVFENP